ncbi:MAG: hypothetical protein WCG45_05830 [bacterium]
MNYEIGTLVLCDSQLWRIEENYSNGVYLIGNNLYFIDMISYINFDWTSTQPEISKEQI